MPLHYCFCCVCSVIDFFSPEMLKKINVSANRVEQKYCRIPFAIPTSEVRFKLKEITFTCRTMNREKNSRRHGKWMSREMELETKLKEKKKKGEKLKINVVAVRRIYPANFSMLKLRCLVQVNRLNSSYTEQNRSHLPLPFGDSTTPQLGL